MSVKMLDKNCYPDSTPQVFLVRNQRNRDTKQFCTLPRQDEDFSASRICLCEHMFQLSWVRACRGITGSYSSSKFNIQGAARLSAAAYARQQRAGSPSAASLPALRTTHCCSSQLGGCEARLTVVWTPSPWRALAPLPCLLVM